MMGRFIKKGLSFIISKKHYEGLRFLRLQKPWAKLFGPVYKTNPYKIEIDITYNCNLKCLNCNRSCKQAESKECMPIEQIEKFIKQSRQENRVWETISLVGGEPTLHPQILDIIQILLSYIKKGSLGTTIRLLTNGFGQEVNSILKQIPDEITIINTEKKSIINEFCSINIAPVDLRKYKMADFSNGCFVTGLCGMGLTPYGYYPCGIGGSIDRVFGFDIGRKELPSRKDMFIKERTILCRYCGRFKPKDLVFQETMSLSWNRALENYKKIRPILTHY